MNSIQLAQVRRNFQQKVVVEKDVFVAIISTMINAGVDKDSPIYQAAVDYRDFLVDIISELDKTKGNILNYPPNNIVFDMKRCNNLRSEFRAEYNKQK